MQVSGVRRGAVGHWTGLSAGVNSWRGTGIMHRKLAFVLAVLAIAIGSASEAQAALAPAAVSSVMRAPRPAAMLGRGGVGATGAAASQRRLAYRRGLRRESGQRSLPGRVTPATGSGTMIHLTQRRSSDVPANPFTAYVLTGTFDSGAVTPITTATNTAGTPITTGSNPDAIAITPDGETAYVANYYSNTVTPITTATNTAGTPITTGSSPGAIAITPDGKTAYVANLGSGTVTPITTATNTAGPPITAGGGYNAIAITPDGTTAYVANEGSNTVTPITTATNTAGTPIAVGSQPNAIAITPDGKTAYVANVGSGTVTPITTATNTAGPPIRTGSTPTAIAITPNGTTAYVANVGSGTVTPITTATNTAGPPIATVGEVQDVAPTIAITPDGTTAYVVDGNSGTVTPITTATNTAGTPITTGGGDPDAIAITPDGKTAYVANYNSDTVTPITTATNTPGTPITTGSNPLAIAIASVPPPAAPSGLAATITGPVSGPPAGVALTWTDNATAPAVLVRVERASDPGFSTGVTDFTVGATATSYTDTTAAEGTTYYYRVRAENQASSSSWSSTASITFTTVPAAPSGLTATVTGPLSGPPAGVALNWTDPTSGPPVTQIVVRRATNAGFTTGLTTFTASGPAATSYTDTTVTEGTSYYYQVQAQNQISSSAWSDPVSITFTTVPPAPSGLTATVTGPVSGPPAGVVLNWTDPTSGAPVTQIVVRRATNAGFTTGLTSFTLAAAATTYTDTTAAEGTTYYYQVQAGNEASSSAWSNTASVPYATVPATPSGLTATVTGPLSGPPAGVALNWTDPTSGPPVTQIVVRRATNAAFTTGLTTFTASGPAATSYTDTTVTEGTSYYYQVQAQNQISSSAWSDPVSITFTTVPPAPSGLTATVTGPVSGPPAGVALNWTDPTSGAPVTQIVVRRATNAGFTTGLTSFTLAAAATTYTDTTAAEGTTYYYQVQAGNEASSSAWSNTASVPYATVPATPSGLTATVTGPLSGPPAGVALNWTDPTSGPPVTQIVVRRATNAAFTTGLTTFTASGPAATSYTDTTVTEGTSYYYQVQAQNQISSSAWSDPVSITFTTVPPAPSGLTATVTGPVSGPPAGVALNWTDPTSGAPVTQIVVRRATNAGFTTGLTSFTLAAAATTYTDTTAAEGTTYYYQVQAGNEASSSAWSNTASVPYATVPATPSGLTATVTGPLSGPPAGVALNWTDPTSGPPVTQIVVRRATNAAFTTGLTTFTASGPAATSYTDTTVTEGTSYYYQVQAQNQISSSAWSDPVSITFTTVPPAPSGLTATVTGPVSGPPAGVALNWTDPTSGAPVTQIVVRRATNAGFTTGLTSFTLAAAATTYTDTTAAEGTTYYYQVQAGNEASSSAWSNTASVPYATVPATPSGLTATVTGPLSGPPAGVALNWTDPTSGPPVTQIVVRRATNAAFTTGLTTFTASGPAATSYTDTTVTEGTSYYYQVQAQNQISSSAWSDPVSITFTTVPPAPSGLTATVTGPVSGPPAGVALNWTDPTSGAPVTQIVVRRATNAGFTTGLTSFTLAAAATTYTDTTAAEGTTYYYQVQAGNEASSSAWSNTASVLVPDVISATGPGDQSSVVGDHVQLPPIQATSSTGLPLTFSASGLPAGLSINPNAGVISGTVTTAGSYTPTVTITDTSGASASAGFTWTIVAADTISVTSPGSQSTSIGSPASLQIHASSGASLPLSYSATGLPAGLSISRSGLITGTAAGPAHSYTPTVTVTDGTASNSVTFTWTIVAADTISVTSPGSQSTSIGSPASLQIHASSGASLPLSYSATGLPAGLSISRSGLITGTAAGPAHSYTPTVTVTDGTASNSVTFTWTIVAADTISVTSPGSQSTSIGSPASLQIHASSGASLPLSYSATGLPAGLSISRSGLITGTAAGPAHSYTPTVTVTDGTASNSVTFTWTIVAADTISVTSPGSQSTSIGSPASLQIHASSGASLPLSYSATGLPAGLSISRSGLITGTAAGPAHSYTPTVTVTDGTASNSVTFTWTIKSAVVVVYSGTIRLTKLGYCLDDRNNSSASGAVVQIWRCTRGPNQVWQVMSDGTIRHNGLCLDAPGTGNGTKVVLATCAPGAPRGPDQQWNTRNGRVNYTNPSAVGKVLNDPGYGGNGTQQVLWPNTGTTNEIWATS